MILPYPPYPVYTGGAVRVFQKIKYFGSRHHLTVASFCGPKRMKEQLDKILKPYCKKTILVKREKADMDTHAGLPYIVLRSTTGKMWEALKKLGENFDIVMIDRINSAMYLELFNSCYTILEEHNIESRILKQYADHNIYKPMEDVSENEYDIKQANLLQAFETQHWPLFNLRTTVSEIDRDLMLSRCGSEILVVNNGIDTDEVQPVEYDCNGKILYMGNMSYRPNIEAVKYFMNSIHPVLIRKDPGLAFCIAGVNITAQVREQAESLNIECIESPQDMSDVAQKCSVTIVPLQIGSGTRIKILHAMAMGLPVVSTSLGCEGLSATDGEHLLVRNDPESFADGVLKIRSDEELRNRLRLNGRRLVKQKYNWHKILRQYENELVNKVSEKSKDVNI